MVTVFLPFRTSATFSIGTSTSLMYSPISSALSRFSMLSLTLCSWPASVWMTNHCVCMQSLSICSFKYPPDQDRHDRIDAHCERAQQRQGHHDHHGRALQFVNRRPGAFFQFFPRFGGVVRHAQKGAFAPGVKEHSANGAHPKPQFDVPVHDLFESAFGGGGGIRTPDGG